MSRHIMKSPDDLDEFEGGQACQTLQGRCQCGCTLSSKGVIFQTQRLEL